MATEKKITFEYDREGDVLYISLGTGEPSYCEEFDDVVLVERGFYSNQITGFRVLGASQRKVKMGVVLKKVIPEAIERERAEIESTLGEKERVYADLIGTIDQRLPKEIKAIA